MKKTYSILRRQDPDLNYRSSDGAKALGRQADPTERSGLIIQKLDEKEAAEAREDPRNLIAEGMRTALIEPVDDPNQIADPQFATWGLEAVRAAESRLTGRGATVAILDTGVDATHPALTHVEIVPKNFTQDGDNDVHGHGTHCAGTIFGTEIGGQRIGVAPGIRRALIAKVLDDGGHGGSQMIFDGLQWAAREGAEIISMSIGFDYPGTVTERVDNGMPRELAVSEVLDAFAENLLMFRNIVAGFDLNGAFGTTPIVIGASGNESRRHVNPDWRVSASLPSSACHLSVAAVDQALAVAYFSNCKAKIAGPGVDIFSAAPGGGSAVMSGTSMACPHVAGVAALWSEWLRNNRDDVSSENLKSHLLANARRGTASLIDVGKGMAFAPPA